MGFMSSFSKESKNTTTTNETRNNTWSDNTVTNKDGVAAAAGAVLSNTQTTTNNIQSMDVAALQAAATLVGQTITANASGQNAAYALASNIGDKASYLGRSGMELGYYVNETNSKLAGALSSTAISAVNDSATSAMSAANQSAASATAAAAASARDALASGSATLRDAFAYSNGVNTIMAKTYDSALGMTKSLSSQVVDTIADNGKKAQDVAQLAIGKVETAWKSAKQAEQNLAGGDYRQLMIIGAAIIGVVAVMALKKG